MWSRLLSFKEQEENLCDSQKKESGKHKKKSSSRYVLLILGDGGPSKFNFVKSLLSYFQNETETDDYRQCSKKLEDEFYSCHNSLFSYRQINFKFAKLFSTTTTSGGSVSQSGGDGGVSSTSGGDVLQSGLFGSLRNNKSNSLLNADYVVDVYVINDASLLFSFKEKILLKVIESRFELTEDREVL